MIVISVLSLFVFYVSHTSCQTPIIFRGKLYVLFFLWFLGFPLHLLVSGQILEWNVMVEQNNAKAKRHTLNGFAKGKIVRSIINLIWKD